MTLNEGICFRNCLNKFNNWYPRLHANINGAACVTYWKLTNELEAELKKK